MDKNHNEVKVVNNNGAKTRWGLSSPFYKTEGSKKSLNTKLLMSLSALFILVSITYSLASEFFKPTRILNSTIGFNGAVTQSNDTQVIEINSNQSGTTNRTGRKVSKPQILGAEIIQRKSSVTIPSGVIVKAQILSQSPQGRIRAVLSESVYVQGEEILTTGVTITGIGQSMNDRLQIRFNKALDKNGKSTAIEAVACEEDQSLGLKGEKTSRNAWLMATGAGLNVLSQASRGVNPNFSNEASLEDRLKNSAINEASRSALDQSQNYLSDFKNQKSIIQVSSGTTFYLLFEGD